MHQRPLMQALLTVVVLPSAVVLTAGSSHAGGPRDFTGSAVSSGVRVLYKNAADNTGTQFDVAGPITSARVTSNPDSAGFAGAPYPGDDLISLVNTLSPALGVPAQPYPASVSSSVPGRPEQSMSLPAGYSLSARSTTTSSKAVATIGPGSAGDAELASSRASSDVHTTATGLLATSTSSTDSFTAGPLLLSRVTSTATAVLDASGNTSLTSTIELGDATVSGQRVGVTRNGLTVAGTDIPLPAGQLTDALAAAGVTVSYISETKTATSVTAPALLVHYKDENQSTTFTLGGAQAAAAGTADSSSGLLPVIDPVPGGTTAPDAAPPGTLGTAGVASVPPTDSNVSAPPPTLSGAQPPPASTQRIAGAAALTPQAFDSGLFYLVLVLAAAAAMAVAQLMRYLGVRWASSSR